MDLSFANVVTDFWNDQLVENDQQALFLVMVGFLGSFVFIRISTRIMRSGSVSWWPGSVVSEGGVHVHHLVFGIVTMMIAGGLGFAFYEYSPIVELCALAFGIGVGLTIDEFALWVHLDDVYWAEEGRRSIDATVVTCLVLLLLMFGVRPFEIATADTAALIFSIAIAVMVFAVVLICFLKERILHAVVGFFIWPIALYGACRIGKPNSPWGKRRYGERDPAKQALAEVRFSPERRTERFKEKFRDIVGGGLSDH